MGNYVTLPFLSIYESLTSLLVSNRESRILILGLDAAGKTTLLYQLKLGETVTTIPTIGFNVETIQHNRVNFTAWDVGGQSAIRPLWRHYVQNTDAVVYVVDATDVERLDEAKEMLETLFAFGELRNAKLLVFANKQDLPSALSPVEVRTRLGVDNVTRNLIFVQGCVAVTGEGLYEGLDWLSGAILNG